MSIETLTTSKRDKTCDCCENIIPAGDEFTKIEIDGKVMAGNYCLETYTETAAVCYYCQEDKNQWDTGE